MNKELNKLDCWKDKQCIICNRKYPDTVLNIEGIIHHNCKPQCLDKKDCKKNQKRK